MKTVPSWSGTGVRAARGERDWDICTKCLSMAEIALNSPDKDKGHGIGI